MEKTRLEQEHGAKPVRPRRPLGFASSSGAQNSSRSEQSGRRRWLRDRRKRHFVHRSLQGRLLVAMVGYAVALSAVVATALLAPLVIEMLTTPIDSPQSIELANVMMYLHSRFWLPVIFGLLAIICHALKSSHRIAGPLYRLNKVLESMKRGVLPQPVRLRKGDYLRCEAETVNEAIEAVRQGLNRIRTAGAELRETAEQFRACQPQAIQGYQADLIRQLEIKGIRLDQELDSFTEGSLS